MDVKHKQYYKFFVDKYTTMSQNVFHQGFNDLKTFPSYQYSKQAVFYDLDQLNDWEFLTSFKYCAKVYKVKSIVYDCEKYTCECKKCYKWDLRTDDFIAIGKLIKLPSNLSSIKKKTFLKYLENPKRFYIVDKNYNLVRENEESECDKKKSLQLLLEKANELVNEIQWDKNENKSKEKCQICWQLKELVVIVDCGDLNFCQECLKNVNKCPLCRKKITKTIRVFK